MNSSCIYVRTQKVNAGQMSIAFRLRELSVVVTKQIYARTRRIIAGQPVFLTRTSNDSHPITTTTASVLLAERRASLSRTKPKK